MFSNFFKKFDKKRFLLVSKLIFVFIAFVGIINIIGKTYSRYESNVDLSAGANIAFFVVDQGTYESSISLTGLTPSAEPKYYTFYVANYNTNNKRADVDLKYTITFETTTNLPLTYEIIRNESFDSAHTDLLGTPVIRQDENDVFYKTYSNPNEYSFSHLSNEVDEYTMKVTFPLNNGAQNPDDLIEYTKNPDSYAGAVELFSIIINATQVA